MTAKQTTSEHPMEWFASRLHDLLDEAQDLPTWTMSPVAIEATISKLSRGIARLEERQLAVVAQAERSEIAAGFGATDTAALVRSATRQSGPAARRQLRLASALDAHSPTQAALSHGHVNLEQTREILAAVDALPKTVSDADRDRAEQFLLDAASEHDALALRRMGNHLFEVIAPDEAEALLAAKLEREEARAARTCSLTSHDDGKGSLHGRFHIPSRYGAMLTSLLDALTNPDRPDAIARNDAEGKRRATPEIRGEAFCQLIERYPVNNLPNTGGVNASVVVTMPLETLEGRLRSANILGTNVWLSPAEARRLACAAGVIPAVLGSRSQVLDLGRRARLHSKNQRLAMSLQQEGLCAVGGCDRPSTWADAHHLHAWSAGGGTDVHDGVLICSRHHTLAHNPKLEVKRVAPGSIWINRRT